jgi:hypothetical protein
VREWTDQITNKALLNTCDQGLDKDNDGDGDGNRTDG